jgi:hypothetical protein
MTISMTQIQPSVFLPSSLARRCREALLTLVLVSLVGCGITPALAKEPLANRDLQVPPGTPIPRLLACAENAVVTLSKTQNNWDDRITLKDLAGGRLETGNFPEKNVIGFRVSVQYATNAASARVQLKGAGPYFVDLGVDAAMAAFMQQTSACLKSS